MGHRFGHDCAEIDHACALADAMLDQLALAPSILRRLGCAVPSSMKAAAFF